MAWRGPGHTHGRPCRTGRGCRAGWAGWWMLPPCWARPAAFAPFTPGNPWSTWPTGHPTDGPLQNRAAPRPREPAAAPLRASGARLAEWGTSRSHGGGGGGCSVCGRRAAARLCGRGGRGGRAAPQPRRLAAAGASRAKRCATAVRLRTGARLRGGRAGRRGAEITRVALKGPRPEPPARHRGGGPGSPAARRQTGQASPPPAQSDPPTLPFE